ncbi:hypothetical protein D9M71_703610 [compost metagenome]
MHAPDPAHQGAGVFAQHFVAVHVEGGVHLHGRAEKTFRAGEVQARAHAGLAEHERKVCEQGLVAGVHAQLEGRLLLQLGQEVLAGKGLFGIEHRGLLIQFGEFIEQTQHGAAATALPGDDVPLASRQGAQQVVDRPALDTCD